MFRNTSEVKPTWSTCVPDFVPYNVSGGKTEEDPFVYFEGTRVPCLSRACNTGVLAISLYNRVLAIMLCAGVLAICWGIALRLWAGVLNGVWNEVLAIRLYAGVLTIKLFA